MAENPFERIGFSSDYEKTLAESVRLRMAGVTHNKHSIFHLKGQQFDDMPITIVAMVALRQVMRNMLLIEFVLC